MRKSLPGLSENFFKERLDSQFETFTNKVITVDNTSFYSDFIIREGKIYIIIEIDEIYVASSGKPIHY